MKTTRRGLFAWLGALTGAAAVAKVAPAMAEPRPVYRVLATRKDLPPPEPIELAPWPYESAGEARTALDHEALVARDGRGTLADFRKQFSPVRMHNEHGLTLDSGSSAYIANPPRTGERYPGLGRMRYGSDTERCPGQSRGCDLGAGHTPCFIRNDRDDYCNGGA